MAGFPVTVPGMTVQRACGSSQQAVHVADNLIRSGVADIVIACGVEMMSKTQGGNDAAKYGRRHPEEMVKRFSLPGMGEAAERIADRWSLERTYLDELAFRSHALAAQATEAGRFARQITPVAAVDGAPLLRDEGVRANVSIEKLAELKTAFHPDGRVTAGNASQVSDGAAAILVMSAKAAREYGLRPRARLVAQSVVGVDPEIMLTGPIPATRAILHRSGLRLSDIDLFEINEAFASVRRLAQGDRAGHRQGQCQRRLDRHWPSARLLGRAADDDHDRRAGAARRPLRPAIHMLRRGPGNGDDRRGAVMSEVDRKWIGAETPAFTVEVERGAIRRFAEAIGDDNPLFHDPEAARREGYADIVAPPTYPACFRLPGDPPWIAGLDRRRIVAGETAFEMLQPIVAGMSLTCRMRLRAIEEKHGRKGTMHVLVQDLEGRDASGGLVFVTSRGTIYRPAEQNLA
jgi:acyl dehydratase